MLKGKERSRGRGATPGAEVGESRSGLIVEPNESSKKTDLHAEPGEGKCEPSHSQRRGQPRHGRKSGGTGRQLIGKCKTLLTREGAI